MKGNRFASGSARPAATSRCAIGLTIAFLVGCSDDPPAAAPADEVIDTDTVVLDTVATDSSPADTLWDILLDGVNDDASNPGDVPGTNAAPLIELLEPASDAHFAFGSPVVLRAIVTDDADLPGDLAVTWSSPIQGSFYEGSPADDGLFSVTTSELVLGTHALTLRAADSAGAESTADVSITIDPLDGAPTLVIEPAAPTTVHDLTATVTDFVLDGSAAALEVTWSWFNGPDPVDVTGAIVSADLTTKGETWRVQAVVSNGTTTTPAGVAQVTIGNAAPSCPGGAVITLGSSGLTCACNGREEPDPADPALDTCAWTGDGAPVAGDCHFDVAPAALAVPGTVLGCTLTPFDGEDAGEDVVAPTVVVPGGDVNSPPTTPTVALTPPFGQPQHTFTCQVVSPASDADGDPISYVVSWAVNGYWNPAVTSETVVPQSALTTSAGAAAGDGDVLRCRVVASDGKASSPAGESGPVTLGTVGVAIDGLGPVTLDEDLGNGCFKDTGFALPSCEPGFPCTVDVKACFAADGSLVGPATVSTTASLPVFGDVALTGSADTADGSLCVAGATADLLPPAVPLALTGLTLTLCRDPSGLWTSSASGRVAIDGETVAFKDADLTTTTGGASFAIALPSFFIDGTPFAGTITVATGATAVPLDGTVTLAPAGVIPASGAFETTAGAFVSAELTAKNTSNIGGIDFALGARLALDSGAWRFEVKGGALTLPGGQPLAVSGDVAVVAGVLKDGVFEAPAGPVTFAGTPFTGPVALAWSKGAWQLTLPGGTLGNDTAFTLRGALTVVAGAVVGGALSAGQDLTLGGVTFVGPAPVSWTSTSLSIALGGGVVSLPAGGVTLSGQLVLDAGTLTAATFDVTGGVALAGLAFPGPTTATWSGDETWALAVSGASLPLPGGSNAPLSGTLTVTGGRVASGGFTSPAPVSFAGLAFAGPATAAYAVPWDDLGSPGAESLTLELAGGALALSGAQSLTLSGDVVIANGQVQSAAFAATDAVSLDSVPFTGATVAFESGRLWLDLAGGTLNVAGAPVTVSGRLAIDAGALGCGELSPDAAASATVGGVAFGLGVRYAPAGRTCTWPDGTTFTSTTGELLAALSGGKLTVDGKTLTLSGNATLEDGTVTCAAFASEGGQRLSIGGVDLLAGAAYSAPSATCPVTTNGAMALALSDGAARFGDHDLVLSGTGVLEGGQLASASLTQPTKLALPGLLSGFGVSASYSLATKSLSVSLTGATLQVAGVTVTIAGSAAITNAQVGCITFSGDVAAPIGGAMMTVGARFAPAGFACEWLDSPVESSTFEVTLAGSATLGGVTAGFSGAGTLRDGRLACAELSAATAVSLSLADASFKAGLRYADGECTWADGTTTDAATPTLLASLSDGQLTIGGATLTLAGTGTLDDGRLACVELRATGSAPLAVAGLDFRAGARFAAQGATCGWSDAPAAEDTLELTLHEGRLRVAGAELLLSGTAVAETGLVRCAAFTVDGGTDLAFGGIAFTGGARFIARGATCDGVSAAEDRLELTLQDGKVDIGGQSVTLSGTGQVVTGGVACIAFTAAGAAPSLYGFTFEIGGFYAAAGATCAGETVSEDTFALTLATAAGPFAMDGLGRVEGGTMACAELDASGDLTELAGVAFDVGARYTAAGRACTWRDGTITAPATDPRFVATLRNGALTIGGQSLALSGEGEFAGGTIACARLDGVGAAAIELGDVSFTAGARYAAAGQTCGWSDGTAARFELSLEDGQIAVAGNTVSLSGRAELAGNAVTCATFTSAATLELGGIAFGVGARYAAAGEACGWSDGTADRFELALNDGKLTALGSTFTLSGRARVGGTRVECAELQSTGTLNLGGTTFAVGARYVAAGATCAWADGTDTSAANDTFDVTLRGGSVDIAGVVIALNGTATLRGGALACAAFEAGGSATVALGGINLGLGGARFAAAGETCTWPDGSTTTADVDTFRIALEGGELRVGNTELSLSGSAELAGGKVTCADLTAGGGTQIDVAGVRFSAGARYAAAGSECGWSDGTANVLQLTLKDGAAQVGDVALTLSGAGEIQDAQLTCADFDVTAGAALAFGGVTFDAGARFAAAGHTCGWSDGSSTRLEVTMNDGAIDVGGDTLQLSGSGVIAGGKLACASFATAAASATVGGLEFAVGGRFAANGATCPWTDGPSDGTAFDLTLNEGTLAVGEATLTLSGAGSIRGGRLACAELDAAGAAPIDVAGITFAVGARYAATGETCVWKDGAETIGTQNTVMLALKDGTLTVGEQSFTLSGAATLENGRLACATLDAIGVGKLGLGGVLFDAGAQYAAAGHACPWTDGPVPEHTLELTLRDGQVAAGDATLMLSGAAEIAGGKLTCADFKGDGAFPVAGLSFATRARYAASGETCGFSDATADRLELLLDDATVRVGDATVVLSGRGLIETGKLRCATFDASGNVPLGGLSATVGGRLATAGATCEWTYGPAAQNRFELTLGGATVNLDGVGAVTLSGYGRVDGGALTCAELGATGELAVGGVEFDLGARFTRAGQTCTWADGTQSSATAHTFTFALLNGSLAVGPTTLALSGAATLSGGKLVCAELDAAGATTIDLAGVRFDAGARYSAAGHPCAWRDGTVTTSTDSTLELALRDGQLAVGPASVTLSGLGQIQNNTLTCAEFDVAGDLSIAGIGFDAGARYAAAGQSCGWSDGAANTLALTLREGALDVGGVQVVLTGSATVAGGALTCASLDTTGAVGLAGLTFDLGARYARAGATCGTGSKAAQDTFEVTLNDGTLTFGSATLSLDGTARVEAARLTCAELGADGGASADLGGITFDADVRYARGGASCSWSDGTTTALEKSALLLGLQNGELRVGDTKLTLRGTGSIVGSQVACAELDAAGGANVALGGVAFDAGARYAGTGHACTWSDGSVRPAGPQALDLHLANGTVTVGENTLTLSGSASLEAGQLTCAELTSTGAVPLGGIMFAAGARYAAAGSECGWSDGQSARFELSLEEGTLRVGNVDVTLAGRGTLAGKALACAELSSSSTVKTSVGGVAFNLGARFIGAGQTCPNGGAPTSDHRFDVTLTDGTLAVDGAALTLAGTAESQGGTLTCATLSSTGQLDLAGVSFTAGARYAASGATCAWATAPAKANQLDLTLDQGQLTVGPTTLTLSGAATLVGSKLTCAELTAGGGATLSLGAVAFEAGARYAAKGETCVYTDGSVALPQASASLRLALAKGEIRAADASVLLAGWGRIDGGELTCAELRSSGDVALAGVSFETGARFTRAGATCTWGDGTTSSAATTTFGLTLDDGRLQVGATELRLSGEGTLVGTELACASLNATGATQIDLAGISFEAGARFTAEGQTCPWTEGDVPNAHVLELTLKNGSLVVGATTVSLSGAARLDGGALSCAELAADGNTTIDLAGATFSVGARYAAADATCTWPDGTVTAPAKDTLAVRLAGQLDVAGQTMAVSGTGTLEGNTVTCAELGATAGFTSVDLGGVSFGTGARYAAAGRTCTWADGSETVASADTYKLELALRDGVVTVAGNTLTLSGTATLEAGQVTSAQLAVTGDVTIAGVTFAASASYDGPSGKLILRLDEGKLEAGFTTIDLEGQGEIDTVSRSVNCVAFSAKGNAAADLAGVTFQVGARYAAKGASCPDMTVPTDGARFEATLEDGTLSLGDGATVTVSGTGTIEGGRILCATFEATGAVSGGSAGVSFDGRARYAAQGQSCGWREAVDAAAIAIDLSSTITIGPNVLTLVGTGTIGAGGVECAALEVTGDVVLAGVTFDVGARAVAAGATCAWPDGTVSLPGVARVEVVLRDGTLSLGDVNARLSGIATAEKTPGGYVVPCLGLDAHADGAWPFGGVAFTGRAEFTAAGRQCGWDAAPVSGHTFSLALEDGALRVGSVNTTLSGSALIASGAARCIEFAAATAVTGFAGITFDLGARYAAAGASCTWQDGTTATYPARTFAARLVDGNVTVGAQSVSLSGSATVAGGTLECAALEAAGDVSVELASTTFSVDGRYAAAGAACEWLAAPYDVNTFTLALEGDLDVDGNTLALTGDATLAGGAITCAAFTSSGDVPLGGLAFDAGARYASAGASCGWNTPEPAARLQVGLSGASVQLGPVALALSGYADLAGNRLECVEFAGSGDLREAFGGVAMTGGARYAATGTTCTWKDGSATTGQAFALDLGGNAKIGSTSVALRGTAAIENGAVRCLTLDAAGADANLAGLDVSVSGLWAAPLATCGDVTAGNSAALQARVAGEFTVGTNTASVSGWGRIEGGSLQCVDLAADGAVSIPLGELNVDLAARFAKAGATCAWEDGTSSTPAKDTLYARLTGDLAVGDDTLALSGNGLVSGGKIACAELASTGKLALAGVTFDAGARYAAGTELCQWEDGSFTPASGAASLRVALDRGVVSVGGNTVELSGLAELNSAVGITCASFDVSGDVAIAGITFAGSGRYAAAGQSCGAWDQSDLSALELAVTGGAVDLGGQQVAVSGALSVTDGRVTSGTVAATGAISLAGLTVAPKPGKPSISLAYSATYDAGQLQSQSLVATLDGTVTIAGLGTFSVSGSGAIVDGGLDAITLSLGAQLTLGGVQLTAQSIDLVYKRHDPNAGGAATLALVIDEGQVAITGLGTLDVSGNSYFTAGKLTRFSLAIATDLTLAGVTVKGGASLLWLAANNTLTFTLDQATASIVDLGTLTLSGQSTLVAGVLDSLELAASGAIALAGTSVTGSASLAYQRVNPITLAPSLTLRLESASLVVAPFGKLNVSGEAVIDNGALTSFDLALDTAVQLGGIPLSGGLSLSYRSVGRELRFSVEDASATIAGVGTLTVNGSALITNGTLGALSLSADGSLTLAGVAIAGEIELVYAGGAASSLTLRVNDATVAITGLDTAVSVSGVTQLTGGRLTTLSLTVSGNTSFQGIALTGALSLEYTATYSAAGAITSRSLRLALSGASLVVPGATVTLGGRLEIDGGAIACADLGPATVAFSGVDFSVTAYYVAAGKTCGRLAQPAPAAVFAGEFEAAMEIAGTGVVVEGAAAIVGGRIDSVKLATSLSLTTVPGLNQVDLSGSYAGGEVCLAGAIDGTLTLPFGAQLLGMRASFCAQGFKVSALDVKVDVIAPNLVGEPLHLLATAGYDGESTKLSATLCLAGETATGETCCAGTSDACPATTWKPFSGGLIPGLPGEWANLAVTTLSGGLSIGGGSVGIDAIGIVDGSGLPVLVPGLSLKSIAVSLSASVGSNTAASAGIRGIFTVPLGEQPVEVSVAGLFELGGGAGVALTLSGGIGDKVSGVSADVEPLKAFIGENTLEISYLTVEVKASTSGVSFKLGGGANVTLPAPVNVGPLGMQLEGYGSLGKKTGFYLVGAICGLTLPAGILPQGFTDLLLGQPSPCVKPAVAVALASRAFPEVEIAPNTTVKRGLTLAATIAPPRGVLKPLGLESIIGNDPGAPSEPTVPFGPLPGGLGRLLPSLPSIVAEIGVDTSGLRLKGALNFPWQVIRPDWNLPAVKLLQLNELAFEVLLNSSPTLEFTGSVLFEPSHCIPDYESFVKAGLASDQSPFVAFDPAKIECLDLPAPFLDRPQQQPLKGTARLRYKPETEFGGEISLQGVWYEPFWVPNLAVASPGITLNIRLINTPYGPIPAPTSLGINGDVFWKRPYYDDAGATPTYPVTCATDADCTGFGNCAGGKCPASCIDGPDGDALPDTCQYDWPYNCHKPDPNDPDAACIDALQRPAPVPASLANSGVTLFYDVYPSPSALLVPLPTVIVRRELNNLSTLDLAPAMNELKDGSRNLFRWMETRLPGISPELSPFPPCIDLDGDGTLDKSFSCILPAEPLPNLLSDLPIAVDIDKVGIYFATHERELFGITFSPGIRADLDTKLAVVPAPTCDAATPCTGGLTCDDGTCKRVVAFSGALGAEGLSLSGRASPVSLLDTITLKGDPFTKFADLRGGAVEVAATPALEALPGTVEAWVLPDAPAAGEWQTVARQVGSSGGGYELQVGAPSLHCDAAYDRCDGGGCALWRCENGPGASLPGEMPVPAPCADDGTAGLCSVCPDGTEPCDLPCATNAECVTATGVSTATCRGHVLPTTDGAILSALKASKSVDLTELMEAAGRACPATGDLAACVAAGLQTATGASVGTALSPTCAGCFADFVTCEERANVRVNVLRGGAVTRTVRAVSPPASLDRWTHVAARFDADTGDIVLFADGALVPVSDDGGQPDCDTTCSCDAVCAASPTSSACGACTRKRDPDELLIENAISDVAADCTSCKAALATWKADAAGNGRWPVPGAGATLRLGDGLGGLDDVRVWTSRRTADQIDGFKNGLRQDASPEKLGDCSNAKRGKCSDQSGSCESDFDCDAGTCVGFIPSGTCRSDVDCTAGATCGGYVPPEQRYAFDTGLLARWEFDYDSYKSALGRAWNTRYHGDPASIDCATTPTGPSAGTCGLIGAPCKDYDVESPLKLHGRYVGGAKWTTAIDDPGGTHADDLFFRFNVPFSGAILSEGGLWVRAGAAFTFPDWLPAPDALSNGGARVDVAFNGMKSAQGSLYVKPFDYLSFGLCQASTTACTTHADCSDPLFGIDELTYCRDDGFCTLGPCLGRLTLSGYGPNGVDDGIDDGFYARVNLLAKPLPTLTAGARASLETLFEPRRDLAFASYDLSCPPGQTCQSAADYRLALATGLQLELPLPLAFDAAGNPTEFIRICGNAATQKPGLGDATADWVLAASDLCPKDGDVPSFGTFIDGDIEVLDQTFSGSALLNSCGFRARSALELGKVEIGDFRLPSLASVNADIMGRFAPFRVCAAGYSEINLALPDGLPATLLEIDSKVTADVCIGEATKYPTRDSGQFLRLLTGTPDGTPHTAHAEFFSLEGGPKLFEVNGSFDLCVGDGDRIGQPGVLTCADNHIKLCGDLNLLDGAIHVENRCFEIRVPHFDLTYSFHEAVELNLAGVLPTSTPEIFIEMCAKGFNAEWDDAANKVLCKAHTNPAFKMSVPLVRLRFRADLTVVGGNFGNVDVHLTANFSEGLKFAGYARYDAGTSTALGLQFWSPNYCEMAVSMNAPFGGQPTLSAGTPKCPPYCLVQSDCASDETCNFGRCERCGNGNCAFGENSLSCPQDCGYPAGSPCSTDATCASKTCWETSEQLQILVDLGLAITPGVCLPCLPGVTVCPAGRYCDGLQLFECRDKAPYSTLCGYNEVCLSGMCQFDLGWGGARCADCNTDAQCPGGHWCDMSSTIVPPSGPEYRCKPPAGLGGKCGIGGADLRCQDGLFCDVDGTCHQKAGNGIACIRDGVCTSSHCCAGTCRACCTKSDCGPGLGCYDYECKKGADGQACVENAECNSGVCVVGICTTPVGNGLSCGGDAACQSGHCCAGICRACCTKADCGPGLGCYDYVCQKGADGKACVENAECASGVCVVGICTTPVGNGLSCGGDAACQSGHCCAGICRACCAKVDCAAGLGCYDNVCQKGADGKACVENVECASGICVQGICTSPGPIGTACFFDDRACQSGHCCGVSCQACCTAADCDPGLGCYDYQCKKTPDGLACTADSQCNSNKCVAGFCRTPGPAGSSCAGDGACTSGHCCAGICRDCCTKPDCLDPGLGCYGNTCRKGNDGEACVIDAECASETCAAGYCTTPAPYEAICYADNACQSGACCYAGLFGLCKQCCDKADCKDPGLGCYGNTCRKGNDGEGCINGAECASGTCISGFCRTKVDDGGSCAFLGDEACKNNHCCAGTCRQCCTEADCGGIGCYGYVCRRGDIGEPCSGHNICASGFCWEGYCRALGDSHVNHPCSEGWQCKSGNCAYSGKHVRNVCFSYENLAIGDGCDVDQECASGNCDFFLLGWLIPYRAPGYWCADP